jgi:phospholipase C
MWRSVGGLALVAALAGCAAPPSSGPAKGLARIDHIIVIYAGDRWGPDTRIPAIIVSPYARRGYVDHTSYDTTSIIKFFTRRFDVELLPGVRANAGDLTAAFDFSQ